jgi:hypothetical protein
MTRLTGEPKWTAYLLGELDPEEARRLEAELEADPELRGELAHLEETLELLRGALGGPVDGGAELLDHCRRGMRPRLWLRPSLWMPAAAAAMLVAGLALPLLTVRHRAGPAAPEETVQELEMSGFAAEEFSLGLMDEAPVPAAASMRLRAAREWSFTAAGEDSGTALPLDCAMSSLREEDAEEAEPVPTPTPPACPAEPAGEAAEDPRK